MGGDGEEADEDIAGDKAGVTLWQKCWVCGPGAACPGAREPWGDCGCGLPILQLRKRSERQEV